MNFIISANTDIGLVKQTNQDSLTVKILNTRQGRMALAVLCDGMGGLAKGEVASASVIRAFDRWTREALPQLCEHPIAEAQLQEQWTQIITEQNRAIGSYGASRGIRLGTTVVAMLLTQTRYYILNVGDSRAYELCGGIAQITNDQTFVAREVAMGNMTEEQAQTDSRRSVLLQCVGASDAVYPDFFFGQTRENAVYMLCCDGFRHEITPEEMYDKLRPEALNDYYAMERNSLELIEENKRRQERDNISVALVRTF